MALRVVLDAERRLVQRSETMDGMNGVSRPLRSPLVGLQFGPFSAGPRLASPVEPQARG
jgi:hypothetical protein